MSPEKSEQRQRYDGLLSEQAKTKEGQQPKGRSSTTAVKAVYSPPTADDDGTTPRLGTAIDDGGHTKKDKDIECDEAGDGTTSANRAATTITVNTATR